MVKNKKNRLRCFFFFMVILIIIFILIFFIARLSNVNIETSLLPNEKIDENKIGYIQLPENFQIDVFADLGVSSRAYPGPNVGPRMMEFKNELLFVSVGRQGYIAALPDKDNDGEADKIVKVIENLNNPHGLAFYEDWLYVAEEDKVVRVKDTDNDLIYEKSTMEKLVDLPSGGHWTRTIKIHDDELYISIGSSCNTCIEEDDRRSAILKCDINGNNCKIFASGTRNAVGFVFHPLTNEIYATENSRDLLGEDLPPDEINIVEENKHYGWPFCYGNNIIDPRYNDETLCKDKEPSLVDLQAHSAPLGLAFYFNDQFPEKYQGKLFVAYHGSWNRKIPTGYKIVIIDTETKKVEDFATGWVTEDFKVLGRPVDVIVDSEGSLFVTDDNAGLVYKISYNNAK
jgi:glucose/arabinose dehydrogenase